MDLRSDDWARRSLALSSSPHPSSPHTLALVSQLSTQPDIAAQIIITAAFVGLALFAMVIWSLQGRGSENYEEHNIGDPESRPLSPKTSAKQTEDVHLEHMVATV